MENSISPQEKMIINMWKPSFLTSFVDTFVDLSISGLILPKHDHQQIPQKPLQTHYPSPSCVVATGGLHGDLEKTMQAFRLGGLIDGSNYWFGASTTVVQIGNYKEFGGSHCLGLLVWCWEQMKSLCRGLEMPFQGIPSSIFHGMLEKFCDSFRARTATLRPNGPISRRLLADNATVLMVGDFVLVHGGVLRNMWIMGWRGRC
ncbi:hypothetical protein Gotri_004035 [Gossypium trilobum]|uniref:Calcineurin-like phosphoesterase domain-containing protein n=1 Tax=Gossypium trilobum TaxID=34281 RepID=A0A7J9F3F1_9ROSI|nr:hypothetical protein [Gossypium trilobum]